MHQLPYSKKQIRRIQRFIVPQNNSSPLSLHPQRMRQISEYIAASGLGIEPFLLETESRGSADVALARHIAMYLLNISCGLTNSEVGRIFQRDRTTAAYAAREVEERREHAAFDRTMDALEMALSACLARHHAH